VVKLEFPLFDQLHDVRTGNEEQPRRLGDGHEIVGISAKRKLLKCHGVSLGRSRNLRARQRRASPSYGYQTECRPSATTKHFGLHETFSRYLAQPLSGIRPNLFGLMLCS
jgi:hypothetical protein